MLQECYDTLIQAAISPNRIHQFGRRSTRACIINLPPPVSRLPLCKTLRFQCCFDSNCTASLGVAYRPLPSASRSRTTSLLLLHPSSFSAAWILHFLASACPRTLTGTRLRCARRSRILTAERRWGKLLIVPIPTCSPPRRSSGNSLLDASWPFVTPDFAATDLRVICLKPSRSTPQRYAPIARVVRLFH